MQYIYVKILKMQISIVSTQLYHYFDAKKVAF